MRISPESLDGSPLIRLYGGIGAVPGFRLAGVHAGLKRRRADFALIVSDAPSAVAACVTTNDMKAAPLIVSAEHLAASGGRARAIACNSGCANACTGDRGLGDARATAALVATSVGCEPEEVIVASTGIIGAPLAMDAIERGVRRAAERLATGPVAAFEAAEAIMTTDLVPKLSAYAFMDGGRRYVVGGIAKGSGMLAPNLATMLAFIGTDAPVGATALQDTLSAVCDDTFNMISVDGDMSTNDAVYALARPHDDGLYTPACFRSAMLCVCHDLAVAMARDGEGATKLLEVTIEGAATRDQARTLAKAIVNSTLVKTAVFGEDPNWGRIVSAAGAAKIGFPHSGWAISVNGAEWVRDGIELMSEERAHKQLASSDIGIVVSLGLGDDSATAWGCDLTGDYVRINASYRT